MKPALRSLRQNQEVWAVVADVIAQEEVVINFSGDLIRVKNETKSVLRPGQRVLVMITEIQPIKLKLILRHKMADGSLDLMI